MPQGGTRYISDGDVCANEAKLLDANKKSFRLDSGPKKSNGPKRNPKKSN